MQVPHADTLPRSISDMYRRNVQCTGPILMGEPTHQPDMAYLDPVCLCQLPLPAPGRPIIEDSLWNLSFLGEP